MEIRIPVLVCCLFAAVLSRVSGNAVRKSDNEAKPLSPEYKNVFTVNSAATPSCTSGSRKNNTNSINSGQTNPYYRWKDFNIWISPDYQQWERDVINNAMWNLWQVLPCINFGIWPTDSTPSGDYVAIVKGKGCNSAVGRQGGRQTMNLESPGCIYEYIAMHEMIHALGFHHEQTRPDREDYITVLWDNIQKDQQYNYYMFNGSSTFGVPYDYTSIMHYRTDAFAINNQPTMRAKNGQTLGDQQRLTDLDKRKLKAMYKCN